MKYAHQTKMHTCSRTCTPVKYLEDPVEDPAELEVRAVQ
jgi:hypothetical protein